MSWPNRVVRIRAETATRQVSCLHFLVADLDHFFVGCWVRFGIDGQTGFRFGATNKPEDPSERTLWAADLVAANLAEARASTVFSASDGIANGGCFGGGLGGV